MGGLFLLTASKMLQLDHDLDSYTINILDLQNWTQVLCRKFKSNEYTQGLACNFCS